MAGTDKAREDRLAAALRANLRKRKEQAREGERDTPDQEPVRPERKP